jgi:hypothetical protein
MKWERLYEITQTKGTGEAHPYLSPNDEFANFELWDKANLDGSVAKKKEMLEFEYARSALKNGLKLEHLLGVNPYKFGLVGGSDAHTGLVAMEEDNFFGKTTPQEPSAERLTKAFIHDDKTGVTRTGLPGPVARGNQSRPDIRCWLAGPEAATRRAERSQRGRGAVAG